MKIMKHSTFFLVGLFSTFKARKFIDNLTKIAQNWKILQLLLFLGHSGVFGVNQKNPKISTNTYRMILFLHKLNSMGETL